MTSDSPEKQKFIVRELTKGEFLVYSVAPSAGYVYYLEEVAKIGDGEESKGQEQLLRAVQFFANHHRLGQERPSVDTIKSALKIRVITGEQQVLFADPLEVRRALGSDAGFIFDRDLITNFGRGDFELGLERIRRYFESIYERDGTIRNANTDLNQEQFAPQSVEDQKEELKAEEEALRRQKILEEEELAAQNRAALESLLEKVEAWETETPRDPAD